MVGNDKIFVAIPTYRDKEIADTIKRALKNADKPENLRFGIGSQFGEETVHVLDEFRGDKRFRIVEVFWKDVLGEGWMRGLVEELYRDEEYVLQTDAHMAFGKGWDTEIKKQWHFCRDEKAVLSTYPVGYKIKDGKVEFASEEKGLKITLCPTDKLTVFNTISEIIPEGKRVMERGLFAVGGMEFFKGEMLKEIKYIREVVFTGSEIIRSAQLYTYGYNIYIPIGLPIFHNYHRSNAHRFWEDMETEKNLKNIYDRIWSKGSKLVNDVLKGDIDPYKEHFGSKRSINEFLNELHSRVEECKKPEMMKRITLWA